MTAREENAPTTGPSSVDRMPAALRLPLLLVVVSLGLLVRTSFARAFARPDGGWWFYSVDAWCHLRRVTLGVASFPRIPAFDSYLGFPKGTGQIWSPLYDYLLSAAGVVAGGSRIAIETICFFANPAFAALSIVLLFLLARALLASDTAALAAAFLVAVAPGHISYSHPMNFDHHVVEPIAVMLLVGLVFLEKDDRLSRQAQLLAGAALVLAILLWRGSTIYWGLTFLRVLLESLLRRRRLLARDWAGAFAVAALAVGSYVAVDPFGNARGFSYGILSGFHLLLLLAAAAVLAVAGVEGKGRRLALAAGLAAAGLFAAFALPPVRETVRSLLDGIAFFRRSGDPWLASNSELKGAFQERDFLPAATYLTLFWFLSPLALVDAWRRWRRRGGDDRLAFAFLFLAPLLAMGLVRRYSHVAALATALAGGALVARFRERWPSRRAGLAVGALLLVGMLPSFSHFAETWESRLPDPMRLGLLGPRGALTWLREKTPPTSHFLDPRAAPEYGILAEWDMGSLVEQVAERPVVATEFGWETHGFYEENVFMASTEPSIAERILDENRVRYVLVRALQNRTSHLSNAEYGLSRGRVPAQWRQPFDPERSMYTRLMYDDGAAYRTGPSIVPGLGRFRLVFESDFLFDDRSGREMSWYKVFELVPGARVTGTTLPGEEVVLELPLRTGRGRELRYTNWARADASGGFSFPLPYATPAAQGETLATAPYRVTDGRGRSATFVVDEQAIRIGRSLVVELVGGAPAAHPNPNPNPPHR